MDRRPDCVYGILVRDGHVFLAWDGAALGLPGGVFRPLAEDRKVELKFHLADQLGVDARAIWAQGAFHYHHPGQPAPRFSGFYTVWDWEGAIPPAAGVWLDVEGVSETELPAPLRILLLSVLNTQAVKTT